MARRGSKSKVPSQSSKSKRKSNAWIIFANEYYENNCRKIKMERTKAMKKAKQIWKNMNNQEKSYYYYKAELAKKNCSELMIAPEETFFIFEESFINISEKNDIKVSSSEEIDKKEKDDEETKFLELFDEFIDQEMILS
ncbi:hypothetical protein RclHR1_04410003 [Rhizophagus clarus]|uniref:Uncharacterized protein n=1 Tax=Rhizophagus clarus TaxID=94130 RepID=A0A2Z6RYN9_9GLOM|nr:hypothetical protein RclHR1_04410003 [Rhizophagus clarus]GES81030.1 hypothetical protein GLOIN_2v1704754 [Rhizophagus clarus]